MGWDIRFFWHLMLEVFLGVSHLRLKTQDGMKGARVGFLREVTNSAQTREVFVEMVQQAREG